MSESVRFEMLHEGERLEGIAPGIDRKLLRKLRRGGFEVEAEVDLHGMDAREAEQEVRHALAEAWEQGLRCVLVVHGRGLRSESGPVLKTALPGWLAKPPHGPRIMAFSSAAPGHGQTGATYILLRRVRGTK